MASIKIGHTSISVIMFLVFLCIETEAKFSERNSTNENNSGEVKSIPLPKKFQSEGAAAVFADEFKQTLERYLFGICPQTFKSRWSQMPLGAKAKNSTTAACDLDPDQVDLAGRLATLALRAHTATRMECARLGAALANTLGELARTAANRQALASASKEDAKKRKLSKSQKAKIQAKQRTALAVKKKAAALAAAAAAKMAS